MPGPVSRNRWPAWARAIAGDPGARRITVEAELAASPPCAVTVVAVATAVTASRYGLGQPAPVIAELARGTCAADVRSGSSWAEALAATAEWPQDAVAGPGALLVAERAARRSAPDEGVLLAVTNEGLRLSLELVADCPLREDVLNAFGEHVLAAVQECLDGPARLVEYCDLLTVADHARIRAYNAQQEASRDERALRIESVVARWVRSRPDALAVEDGSSRYSYAQLWKQSGSVAATLAAHGVGRGSIVACAFPRSAALAPALLGVLRTGAAYLVLDLQWPEDRLREALAMSTEDIVLAHPDAELPEGVRTVGLAACAGSWPDDPQPASGATAPACVYFTSGSSGRPKGAVATHGSVLRVICGEWPGGFGPDAVVLQAAALPWDVMGFELWGGLANGARVLVHELPHLTPRSLRDAVESGVDTVFVTTSLFNVIVDEDVDAFASTRCVFVGGERLSPRHVRGFLERHPGIRLVNGYGPVETNFATFHDIVPRDVDAPSGIPLGPLVSRTSLVCVRERPDGSLAPVPTGAPGEIVIGGDGVALGYVGDGGDGWRFLEDASEWLPGRWYRTGDTGALLPDGQLVYGGRDDRQVKIRGTRVEPAEVEVRLEHHPAVKRAVAVPVIDPDGTRVRGLAAYCAAPPGSVTEGLLRDWVAEVLPATMVPERVCLLPDMPLLANGKVDVRSLPVLAPQDAQPLAPVGGSTLVELVRATFADVLGMAAVDDDDDFVALGGDSLAAIRISSRLERRTGRTLSPAQVLADRTPRVVTRSLQAAPAVPFAAAPTRAGDAAQASPAQRRFWILDQLSPADPRHVVQLGFAVRSGLHVEALVEAWRDVVARHDQLRTTLVRDGKQVLQRVLDLDAVRVQVEDEVRGPADEATLELARREQRGFALGAEAPARLAVAAAGGAGGLVLTIHHSVFDGWSERILAADLATAYDARAAGCVPRWPASPAPYAAHAQSALAPASAADQEYWAERLADIEPLRWVHGPASSSRGALHHVRLEIDPAPLALIRRARLTSFTALLAAYAGALRDVSAGESLAIGVAAAGRDDARFDDTIGLFVNPLALALRPDEGLDDDELLVWAQRAITDGLAHAGLPFDAVVERLRPPRPDRRHPFFQTRLGIHDPGVWSGERLDAERVLIPPCEDPLDLSLDLWSAADGALRGFVTFDRGRVDEGTVQAVVDALLWRLRRLTTSLDRVVARGRR